jgi:hypothetical protein
MSVSPRPGPASVAHKINSFISTVASLPVLSAAPLPQYNGLNLQAAGCRLQAYWRAKVTSPVLLTHYKRNHNKDRVKIIRYAFQQMRNIQYIRPRLANRDEFYVFVPCFVIQLCNINQQNTQILKQYFNSIIRVWETG